jgi:small-conductance mechanosensitive channel
VRLLAAAVYDTSWFKAILYVLIAMVVARIADALLRRRDRLQSRLTGREPDPADRTRYVMIRRLIVATILFFGVAMALWQFQAVSALAQTLLASAAIFGAVVGIAARAPLANLVSGIMIAFSQPVRLNDYISVDEVFGTVERISLTYTFIRTPDDDLVVIPNEAFANRVVHNYTMGAPGSVLTVAFTVPQDTDLGAARVATLTVADELAPPPTGAENHVDVDDIRGREVVLRARVWTHDPKQRRALASDLRAAIAARLAAMESGSVHGGAGDGS